MSKAARDSQSGKQTRRSVCPVSCALDILGDKWTLLVVRDLLLGKTRFKEFVSSPEKIPTNILADRLDRLLQHEIIRQVPVSAESKRYGYQLTDKGEALKPVLFSIMDWGLEWEDGTEARLLVF